MLFYALSDFILCKCMSNNDNDLASFMCILFIKSVKKHYTIMCQMP